MLSYKRTVPPCSRLSTKKSLGRDSKFAINDLFECSTSATHSCDVTVRTRLRLSYLRICPAAQECKFHLKGSEDLAATVFSLMSPFFDYLGSFKAFSIFIISEKKNLSNPQAQFILTVWKKMN